MKPFSILKRFTIILTLAVAPLTISNAQAAVKVGSYVGTWKASITYAAGDLITYSDKTFLSLAKNKNKNPNFNPKVWQVLGGVGVDGVGLIGPQGIQGIQGVTATQGPIGLPGLQGVAGPIGLTGLDGAKGIQGTTGLIGPAGVAGTDGVDGVIGSQGLPGAQGVAGSKGDTGLQGATGTNGIDGATGSQGLPGVQGIAGSIGLIGPAGAAGASGIDGARGPQGLKGDTGSAGTGSFTYSNTCGVSGTDACKVGAVGPGGGWIFFVDYNDQYPGFTYLEAAPTDINPVVWCDLTNISIPAVAGWSSKGVGKGQANTTAMLGVCSMGAANEADLYLTGTKSDWFLPSLGEAKLMNDNLLDAGVGGFALSLYWSSTESSSTSAWAKNFYDGSQFNDTKTFTSRVRAARAF
jgi:hypothetical protein